MTDPSEQPLICLRCGTGNHVNAEVCANCKAPLIVPDLDFNLRLQASARTSMGKVRRNNEDNISLWALHGVLLALVADGMGGEAAGEVASQITVDSVQADFLGKDDGKTSGGISETLQMITENELSDRMTTAIRDANQAIYSRAQADPSVHGMGTTSTMALVRGNRALIAHVGDSRAYLVDATGGITQVTNDHSFTQALVASGHLTPEQAAVHPMGHVLYRALGQSPELEVDLYSRYLRAGDRLVMCSDGLTRHLEASDITQIVTAAKNPSEATQKLVDLTNARGGEDNVSAIVIMMLEA